MYLIKDYIIPIGDDRVDFTEVGILIAFQQLEALLFQLATVGSF